MRSLISGFVFAGAAIASVSAAQAADYGYGDGGGGYSAPAGPQDWSGLYVGGHVGVGFGDLADADTDGFLIGLQGGSNWQFNQLVVGLEADVSYSGVGYDGLADSYEMDWLGTVRGRIGFAFDRFVAYGTGGFAWARAEYDDGVTSRDNTHIGWTLGGGLEASIAQNISAKAEYLYMEFDGEDYSGVLGEIEPNLHTVKVGVNYRF